MITNEQQSQRTQQDESGNESDSPVAIAEAVALFPSRNGKPVTVETLKRRIKIGCRGVRLGGFLSGACWFTTRAAIEQFHRELTLKEMGNRDNGGPARRVSSKAARDYLKTLGIGSGNQNKSKGQGNGKAKVVSNGKVQAGSA